MHMVHVNFTINYQPQDCTVNHVCSILREFVIKVSKLYY